MKKLVLMFVLVFGFVVNAFADVAPTNIPLVAATSTAYVGKVNWISMTYGKPPQFSLIGTPNSAACLSSINLTQDDTRMLAMLFLAKKNSITIYADVDESNCTLNGISSY